MTDDPDSPGARFERFIAEVEERPRYRPGPPRWRRHPLPVITLLCGALALTARGIGRVFGAW